MASNKYLKDANKNKNDEFYTQLKDIERELFHYKEHFKDKVIYCNCDDPRVSNFFKYFYLNFEFFGLKRLVTTCYKNKEIDLFSQKSSEKAVWIEYEGGGDIHNFDNIKVNELQGDGDFRSNECIEILKTADIVVTNPPFSLFREYVAQLMEYEKHFVIIGPQNAITYKDIFQYIVHNKLWLGYGFAGGNAYFATSNTKEYAIGVRGEDGLVKFRNCHWFTNLDIKKRHEDILLWREYRAEDYPFYENYDAINVDKTADIPLDYFGNIGVPITFLDKYNPDQFEIVELGIVGSCSFSNNRRMEILKDGKPTGKFTYNAKGTLYRLYNPSKDKKLPAFKDCETGVLYTSIYARVIIRRRKEVLG